MKPTRDPEADDLFLDVCLDEVLGRRLAPDFVPLLARRDRAASVRAAAAVDMAARAASMRWSTWWWALAGAALLAIGIPTAIGVLGAIGDSSSVTQARDPAGYADSAVALLDEFHRVMPRQPSSLRDPDRRQRLAPRALPVLQKIAAFHRDHPDESVFASRTPEFVVYAEVLGDPATHRVLTEGTARADIEAESLLLTARVIRTSDDRERAAALSTLATHFRIPVATAANVVQCLVSAGDLSETEARSLAAATADPALAQRFRMAAELARSSPRRLLGEPLDFAGRLVDGAEFSTVPMRGKVVLVCFWATWCKPCLLALPELMAVTERYAESGLVTVGVSCDHDRNALSAYLSAHPELKWPQLFDPAQPGWHELAWLCGVRSIPSVLLIDREGIVREVDVVDDLDMVVRRAILKK